MDLNYPHIIITNKTGEIVQNNCLQTLDNSEDQWFLWKGHILGKLYKYPNFLYGGKFQNTVKNVLWGISELKT